MSVQAPVAGSLDGSDVDTALLLAADPAAAQPDDGPGDPGESGRRNARGRPVRSGGALSRVLDGPVAGTVALLAVAVPPAVEVTRILIGPGDLALSGRVALSASAARRAAHLSQLSGPPTRFGFHQLGPALYYLLAVFVRTGPPTRGVFVGAVAVNGIVLGAAVAVAWRRFGAPTALWMAAAIDVWCMSLGVSSFRDPLAGAMIVAPVVLFVALWAAAISGSRGAYVWAVVVASCEVQTHAVTAIFCAGMLVVGAGAAMAAAAGDGRLQLPDRWWRSPARSLGLTALALVWLPPVIASTGGRPDNVRHLWDFVTGTYPTLGLHRALTAASSAAMVLPLGAPAGSAPVIGRSTGALLAVGAAAVVLVLVTLWFAYQRRSRAAYSFTAAAVVGGVTGTLSLTRTFAGHGPPTAAWLAFVPLSLLIGLGAAVLGPLGPARVGAGFTAALKAPFKWVKKHLPKRSRLAATGQRLHSDESRRRHAGGKKAAGLAAKAGAAGKDAAHRSTIPSPQWTAPAVWVVPVLLVVTLAITATTVASEVRIGPLPAASGPAVAGHPAPGR